MRRFKFIASAAAATALVIIACKKDQSATGNSSPELSASATTVRTGESVLFNITHSAPGMVGHWSVSPNNGFSLASTYSATSNSIKFLQPGSYTVTVVLKNPGSSTYTVQTHSGIDTIHHYPGDSSYHTGDSSNYHPPVDSSNYHTGDSSNYHTGDSSHYHTGDSSWYHPPVDSNYYHNYPDSLFNHCKDSIIIVKHIMVNN
jgi:hypothetical protein